MKHAMVERDDFWVPGRGMRQEESGLVSTDIWDEMVDRLRRAIVLDLSNTVPRSRGRHHREVA